MVSVPPGDLWTGYSYTSIRLCALPGVGSPAVCTRVHGVPTSEGSAGERCPDLALLEQGQP